MKPPPFFLLTALLLLTTVLGCQDEPDYEYVYTTRGVIVSLPGEKAYEDFMVRHEALPDYVSLNGSIGMDAMTMPFPIWDRELLKGMAVGDKVQIIYGERFNPTHKAGVIAITKLPPDTVLHFGKVERD